MLFYWQKHSVIILVRRVNSKIIWDAQVII